MGLVMGETWPDAKAFGLLAEEYPVVPVARICRADLETPTSLYLKLVQDGPGYLLESVEGGERLARYSFVGARPFLQVVAGPDDDPFAQVREVLAAHRAPALNQQPGFADPPPFTGGLVGYVGYDAVRALERLPAPPPDDRDLPVAWLLAASIIGIFDHVRQQVVLVAVRPREQGESSEQAYVAALRLLDEAEGLLGVSVPGAVGAGPAARHGDATPAVPDFPRGRFLAAVARAKEYIAAGDVFQVVLSQRLRVPLRVHPFDLYRSLRRLNPSPYLFYLNFGRLQLVGASPEMLVRVEGDQVTTRPIAGTRPRGRTPLEDGALEEDLRTDPKELAEHAMLLDLGRNDVGRVSRYGSVAVHDPMHVERYSHVMHLVSEVTGTLAPGRDATDALAACFPAGTLSGAPKVRAMEIIDELEPLRRGPYGGAVGYFGFAGGMDTCIAIRAALVQDGVAHLQAGAGIVAGSEPESEYQECLHKASALLQAAQLAEDESGPGTPVTEEEGASLAAGHR